MDPIGKRLYDKDVTIKYLEAEVAEWRSLSAALSAALDEAISMIEHEPTNDVLQEFLYRVGKLQEF